MTRSHLADCITIDLVDRDISVAGWIEDIRDIGKLGFVSIRDFTGMMQIIVAGDLLGQIQDDPKTKLPFWLREKFKEVKRSMSVLRLKRTRFPSYRRLFIHSPSIQQDVSNPQQTRESIQEHWTSGTLRFQRSLDYALLRCKQYAIFFGQDDSLR